MPSVRLALCLSLAALGLLGAAPAAPAEDGWSVAPATDGVGGRSYLYAEGEPGTVLQDAVSVVNPGSGSLTVRLSGADDTADGGSSARSRPAGSGAWIGFARTTGGRRAAAHTVSVTVPGRTRAIVPFSVTVPSGAALGDHPAVIVARAGTRSSAVRVRVRVTGPALSALTVEHVRVRAGRVTYELVNRGTTVLAPRLAVRADGVLGRVLDRAPRTLPLELPPGRRVRLTEPWPHQPALDAVDVTLTVTAAGGAHGSASAPARFVPWGTVAASTAGLLAAVGAGAVVRRHRYRPPDRDADEQAHPEVELTGAGT
ncbi:hypothetical protein AB0919_15010 [Streptomyces sp. NPDC046994]|uniref:hypothetical protein n=1 Tax=Streptomyces sp. NPDC046994 TaxID=3155735 RepID=UPI00345333FD